MPGCEFPLSPSGRMLCVTQRKALLLPASSAAGAGSHKRELFFGEEREI